MEELEEEDQQQGEGIGEEKENAFPSSTTSSSSQLPSECFPLFQNEDAIEEHRGVNGIQVVKDPFVGHVLIVHTDFQEFMVINVTTHLKLCQLQTTLQVRNKLLFNYFHLPSLTVNRMNRRPRS